MRVKRDRFRRLTGKPTRTVVRMHLTITGKMQRIHVYVAVLWVQDNYGYKKLLRLLRLMKKPTLMYCL